MEIRLLPHQKEFMVSNSKHTALIGGFGSGKTRIGVEKTIVKKLLLPNASCAYYLPTYPLIHDVAMPVFADRLHFYKIPFTINKQENIITTKYGKILLRNMSDPDKIIGYEVGYSLIDETDILSKAKMSEVFNKIIGRNRTKLTDNYINQTDVVGTPEGFKWLHEFFVKNHTEDKKVIKAKTSDNPFLPSDYIDTLRSSYTEEQIIAYINGEFVNMNNKSVYYCYNRTVNRSAETVKPKELLYIGLDFNITNMNAVVHVMRERKMHAVGEIVGAYDTKSVCDALRNRYPNNNFLVNPDASGNSRSTSGSSDFSILKQNGFPIKAPSKNPSVKERVNAVNLAFQDLNYYVNDSACPSLAEALEHQTYKNDIPDKTSGYDHITEAAGYCIFQNMYKNKMMSFR